MEMDLRFPVGLLFVTLGLIMGIFGLTTSPELYHKSLDINVNLYWGLVELIFGSIMIAFGRPGAQTQAQPSPVSVAPTSVREKAVTTRHDLPPSAKPPVPHG